MNKFDQLTIEEIETVLKIGKDFPLFKKISIDERMDLLEKAFFTSKSKGEYIFTQGEEADFFFLVYSGKVLAYSKDKTKKTIIGLLSPGKFCGYKDVLKNNKFSATTKTWEDGKIIVFKKEVFLPLISGHPELKEALLEA